MTTIAFVIWMIGWPMAASWIRANELGSHPPRGDQEHSELALFLALLTEFVIWIVVAYLLWTHR